MIMGTFFTQELKVITLTIMFWRPSGNWECRSRDRNWFNGGEFISVSMEIHCSSKPLIWRKTAIKTRRNNTVIVSWGETWWLRLRDDRTYLIVSEGKLAFKILLHRFSYITEKASKKWKVFWNMLSVDATRRIMVFLSIFLSSNYMTMLEKVAFGHFILKLERSFK